jgi:hypothetical protein
MRHCPRRSTLADANKSRPVAFFEDVFKGIYKHYYGHSPDSRSIHPWEGRIFIVDSTTIELFSDIMQGAVRAKANGKRKGGVKAHVLMNALEDVPSLVCLTEGKRCDKLFSRHIDLPAQSILVHDRGYINFKQWQEWTGKGIFWVSRMAQHFVFEVTENLPVSEKQEALGVVSDQKIILGSQNNRQGVRIPARLVTYKDQESGKLYTFLTNHYRFSPANIAMLYKRRWQIECLFKRLKQNYPLRYFLGDNENAIKIQVWCSLIADLLLKILKDKVKKPNWSYTNLAGIIRLHLMNYINLVAFLLNPDKALLRYRHPIQQLSLFPIRGG